MTIDDSIDILTESLDKCAEVAGDVVPAVYTRFFELSQEGRLAMEHSDQQMQGRMFEEVVGILMSDQAFEPGGYLDWELNNHLSAYSATPPMYEAFFEAIIQVVRENLGSAWTDEYAEAWGSRVKLIIERVDEHCSAQGQDAG